MEFLDQVYFNEIISSEEYLESLNEEDFNQILKYTSQGE